MSKSICNDVVVFYPENNNDAQAVQTLFDDINKYHEPGNSYLINTWLDDNHIDPKSLKKSYPGVIGNAQIGNNLGLDPNSNKNCVTVNFQDYGSPATEIYDIMAKHYNMKYVLLSENDDIECFINTDETGQYLGVRYKLDCFETEDLEDEIDENIYSKYKSRLEELGEETHYLNNFNEVAELFKDFDFNKDNIKNFKSLSLYIRDTFGIEIYKYATYKEAFEMTNNNEE